jgi:hypothetical protein
MQFSTVIAIANPIATIKTILQDLLPAVNATTMIAD